MNNKITWLRLQINILQCLNECVVQKSAKRIVLMTSDMVTFFDLIIQQLCFHFFLKKYFCPICRLFNMAALQSNKTVRLSNRKKQDNCQHVYHSPVLNRCDLNLYSNETIEGGKNPKKMGSSKLLGGVLQNQTITAEYPII